MEQLDLSRAKIPLFQHQVEGVEKIIDHPFFFLTDEMGAGKTYQAITAAMVLYERDEIDTVIVVAPAPVRSVWYEPELGELRKYLWPGLPASVCEFHAKRRWWFHEWGPEKTGRHLRWVITNYDFIRSKERVESIKKEFGGKRTLLILDESSAVKNYRAQQTKACLAIRRACARVLLMNGTPIANSPLDLYSQGNILDPQILQCQTYFHFRSRYAVMGGWQRKQVIGWQNLEDLNKRFAPFVLRRLKRDCLDLPEKMEPVALTVHLTDQTWALYKEMRDELVAWLDHQTVSVASLAVTKAMRLAQICSGFVGGNIHKNIDEDGDTETYTVPEREVGREKLDVFLKWLEDRIEEDPTFKMIVWCRFRPELRRLVTELPKLGIKNLEMGQIWGEQSKNDRAHAIRLLDPRTAPKDHPVVVAGTPSTGKFGLNLTAAWTTFYMSNDYSLMTRSQSMDRIDRIGQVRAVSYYDLIAVGPKGQRTIDYSINRALRSKEDLARLTTNGWRQLLVEE